MTQSFSESDMNFEFEDDCLYRIEESSLLSKVNKRTDKTNSYSACECVVMINEDVTLIEAKTSAPHPNSKENFNEFIDKVASKFRDTMMVFYAARLRHPEEAMGSKLRGVNLETIGYRLILIIRKHENKWLPPVSDAVKYKLRPFLRLWNIKDTNIKVINESIAKEKNIIK